MQNTKSKSRFCQDRYFICLILIVAASFIAEALSVPTLARRSRTSRTVVLKRRTTPFKKEAVEPDTSKQFFQDVNTLGRAYALYDLGLNEYIVGDYGLAADHLNQASQIFSATYGNNLPQQETLFYDLALAQEGAGKLDEAIASYNRSLSQKGFFDGYLALAQLYGRMGKWQEGLDAVSKAINLRPDDPRANLIYGLILEKQGQLVEAEKYKAKARDFVSTYGLFGVKNTADKELPGKVTDPVVDNLPEANRQDLELP